MSGLLKERAAFLMELTEFMDERKDMSIAEIWYSIGRNPENKVSNILSKTDTQMLNQIEKSREDEK